MSRVLEVRLAITLADDPRGERAAEGLFGMDDLMASDLEEAFEVADPAVLTHALFGRSDMAVKVVEVKPLR